MKYLVVECHKSYAVVLSDDGKFIKTANMHYEIGQSVNEIVEMKEPAPKRNKKWIYSIASVAACFIIAVAGIFGFANEPYGSVYVTINPQVRVDVDKQDIVVGLEGVNADGVSLIQNYSYENKVLDTVVDELVDMAIEQGYLHEGKTVTLSFDSKDSKWVESHKTELAEHVTQHLNGSMAVSVEISEIINEVVEEAVDEVVDEVLEEVAGENNSDDDTDDDDFDEDDYDDDFEEDDDDDFEEDDDDEDDD